MTDAEQVIVLDESRLPDAQEIAARHHVELSILPVRGFEPVSTITVVLLGSSLAVGTVAYLLDKQKGGQVIDLRPGAPKAFYRTNDLIYGLIAIVTVDGSVTVEVKEPRGMYGIAIDALRQITSSLAEATVSEIASQANDRLGDSIEVSTTVNAQVASQDPAPAEGSS